MIRSLITIVLASTVGLAASQDAHALDAYMWGVGPRVGTSFLPAKHPVKWPNIVEEDGAIDKIAFDFIGGVDAVYYINKHGRTGLSLGGGVGTRYTDLHAMFKYSYLTQTGAMDFLFGGGAGFGSQTMRGTDAARLRVGYFPLRLEGSALVRDNSRGYQATLFGQMNIPSNHFYTNAAGEDVAVRGTPVNYVSAGIELTVFFGDFTPPKRKRSAPAADKE